MAKRFDRNFKVTGQQDARGYLYIFAAVPLDDSIEVTPVDKDLSVPGFLVDDHYILTGPSGPRIKHLEAELRWRAEIPRHMGGICRFLSQNNRSKLNNYSKAIF